MINDIPDYLVPQLQKTIDNSFKLSHNETDILFVIFDDLIECESRWYTFGEAYIYLKKFNDSGAVAIINQISKTKSYNESYCIIINSTDSTVYLTKIYDNFYIN